MAAYVKRGDTRFDELCQSKVLTAVRTCYSVADGKCVVGAGTWGVRMAERSYDSKGIIPLGACRYF